VVSATFLDEVTRQSWPLDGLRFFTSGGRASFTAARGLRVGAWGMLRDWADQREVIPLFCVVETVDPHPEDDGRVCVIVLVRPAAPLPALRGRGPGEPGAPLQAGE
jgi:hypothetical protein